MSQGYARMASTGQWLLLITWNATPVLKLSNPVRSFASPHHNEVGLDTLSEQQNAISRKPMLENTFRFAPFPGHVGNQPL